MKFKMMVAATVVFTGLLMEFTSPAMDGAKIGNKDQTDSRPFVRIPFLTQKPVMDGKMTKGE